jgi:hypothetical protein
LKNSKQQIQALRKEEKKDDGSILYTTTITEEKRLAAVVIAIDGDGAVAPRGAYFKSHQGQIELNPSFAGSFPFFSLLFSLLSFSSVLVLLIERSRCSRGKEFEILLSLSKPCCAF